MKYVLVTGGVVSGLGKGVTASSIGLILKACGLRVTSIKIDPYLNSDAGTMSPFEHGEVFVLDDGGEVDLDLGNYERFLDIKLTRDNNITTGKVFQAVIDKERRGDYLGQTVQVVPHITDAIQEWIERVAAIPVDGKEGPADVCVIELGGTIGDIESMPFIEALGQFSYRVGAGNFCLIHVSLVPVLTVVGEQKTKPTQHSVRGLRSLGLTPNILACRSTMELDGNVKEKLSRFCHVPIENIITLYDVSNIWHVPLLLRDQKAHEAILKVLNLNSDTREPALGEWTSRADLCDLLNEPGSKTHMGGTMRLGSRRTYFQGISSKSARLYGNRSFIDERHRHRYEVNPDMVKQLEDGGLCFTGKDETGRRMEIIELPNHPYFVGVQFHPEFKSRPGKPSALFLGLVAAACGQLDNLLKKGATKPCRMSNGSAIKAHLYENATKLPNGSLDGIYCNGNGLHV
ncbi:UNVERIFIED_CONTAM: CTP synthase 1 [Sesamum calycinum]|uniref:CTP synthase n=1 Tax=Sesamum calycinum TaxID=2727403 RepID=A0AAW2Q851_9LAMI